MYRRVRRGRGVEAVEPTCGCRIPALLTRVLHSVGGSHTGVTGKLLRHYPSHPIQDSVQERVARTL